MINRKWINQSLSACLMVCGASVLMTGCGSEEPAPVVMAPTPPPAPPAPPPPAMTPVADLMTELNIDKRVILPEDKAPDNDIDRRAVLVFFDAVARGNAPSLKGMLPLTDQLELTAMVDSGVWKDTVAKIQKIQVQTGFNNGNKCALAVLEIGKGAVTNFEPQLWYFTTDQETPTFESAPAPPDIIDRLTGDWIATWHQILDDETQLASKPETEVELAQKNLDDSENDPSAQSGGPQPGNTPRNKLRAPPSTPQTPSKGPKPGG